MSEATEGETHRLAQVRLDPKTIPSADPDRRHDLEIAVFDLVDDNRFEPTAASTGPYSMALAQLGTKLSIVCMDAGDDCVLDLEISLTPIRTLMKDYNAVCDSYYSAIRTASPRQIEMVDRERTALHNQGAKLLIEKFAAQAAMDESTGRRLFTLIAEILRR